MDKSHSLDQPIAVCLKYNHDTVEHKISHNLDTALEPNHKQNIALISFLKQTNASKQI